MIGAKVDITTDMADSNAMISATSVWILENSLGHWNFKAMKSLLLAPNQFFLYLWNKILLEYCKVLEIVGMVFFLQQVR